MKDELSFYKNILDKNGYKFTTQKRLILNVIINSKTHLTAKEIYLGLKDSSIGMATVYRSLKLFGKLDIIKEISANNTSYYEKKIFSANPLHIHFKCSKCNSIIDIDDVDLNLEYIKLNSKVEKENNLEIHDMNIMLVGLCDKCKEDK